MEAKYVMTDKGIIVFPKTFKHSDFRHLRPLSAGFIYFKDEPLDRSMNLEAVCYGESESLKLQSNELDSQKATRQLFNEY